MDHGGLAGVIVERHSMGVRPASTAKPGPTQKSAPRYLPHANDGSSGYKPQVHFSALLAEISRQNVYLASTPAVTECAPLHWACPRKRMASAVGPI
jgi:hypothetical protein